MKDLALKCIFQCVILLFDILYLSMTNSVILYRVPFHIFELNELLYQSQGCSACQSVDKTIVPKGHNDTRSDFW